MYLQNTTDYGYLRVASAVPAVNVADVNHHVESIICTIHQAIAESVELLVFPELCVTGYSCADLFGNELLLDAAEAALEEIKQSTEGSEMLVFVGAPLRCVNELYNCAVCIQSGCFLGVVPKSYLPNYKEFYEKRWFSAFTPGKTPSEITINHHTVPFGGDLIFESGKVKVGVDICEDLWVPIPPSSFYALHGANVIVNLSASNELIGKHQYLVDLIKHQSAAGILAYVYSSAGYGESSTDLVFAGNAIIAENGSILREGARFDLQPRMVVADVDIEALNNERRVNGSFADNKMRLDGDLRELHFNRPSMLDFNHMPLLRSIDPMPFVPFNESKRKSRCEEIINIQTQGLMRRLQFTHISHVVVGVSGGLDSTLALLVAVRAFDRLGIDRKQIHGITMPGFGTTDRTYNNAVCLMHALGVAIEEISIAAAVKQHFTDIHHDIEVHNVTYENSQARERTQILMDLANKYNGLVLGTGDLSELALGWATYNGDHMSMYNVNVSIPKTLAKYLVKWFALSMESEDKIRETLLDVLSTPISPELTPADSEGNIQQKTEDLVGPYELHDFFLYYMLRYGFGPRKIFLLANEAFNGRYSKPTLKKWLTKFYWRFFTQQFKRSCLPDGPKVGSISLSPRGDWRMPSDAAVQLWIKECENLPEE